MTTELRTYVGQPGTLAYDGFAGFSIGQQYTLRFWHRDDGTVVVMPQPPADQPLLVSEAQFIRW